MAGEDSDVVAKWEQFLFDSPKQQWRVATGQIPSADAARKENVASDQELLRAQEKAKAAGTMAGDFENLESGSQEFPLRRFLYKKIRSNRFKIETKPELSEEIWIRDHGAGIRVTTYWAIKFSLNFRDINDVIDVSVGQDQQL